MLTHVQAPFLGTPLLPSRLRIYIPSGAFYSECSAEVGEGGRVAEIGGLNIEILILIVVIIIISSSSSSSRSNIIIIITIIMIMIIMIMIIIISSSSSIMTNHNNKIAIIT